MDIEIKFCLGAFDDFEGTQEELDALVKQVKHLAQTGELFELMEEVDDEMLEIEIMQVRQPLH